MPIAMLITPPGDARDAVGLFLAGRGWTVVPVAPEVDRVHELFAAACPAIVVADYRGDAAAVTDCIHVLLARGARIYALNTNEGLLAEGPGITVAREANDIPRAPGAPASPHPPAAP